MSKHIDELDFPGIRTRWIFLGLVTGEMAVAALINHRVLTDQVYLSLLPAGIMPWQAEEYIALARRWEILGYTLTPLGLLTRVGGVTLLIQLVLLPAGFDPGFARIFRASTWGYLVLLSGTAIQAVWLLHLPPAGISAEVLSNPPGSLVGIISRFFAMPTGGEAATLAVLLRQVTVFDLGWIMVITLALEGRTTIPAGIAFTAVAFVWTTVTFTRWAILMYLLRSGWI